MIGIYYILSVDYKNKVIFTDVTLNKDDALDLAFEQAISLTEENNSSHTIPLNIFWDPDPIKNEVDSLNEDIRWVYLNNEDAYVVVEYRTIAERQNNKLLDINPFKLKELNQIIDEFSKESSDKIDPIGNFLLSPVQDEPFADNMPGGFSYDNKPLNIREIKNDIINVKGVWDLTEAQQWALVTARIKKQPNYFYDDNGTLSVRLNQNSCLHELKNKTNIGFSIKEFELSTISDFMYDLNPEESSSSSSSEESSDWD